MKKHLITLGLALSLFITGCSSLTNSTSSSEIVPVGNNAPGISNLVQFPANASVGEGGGALTALIDIDFIDNDGDLASVKLWSDGPDNTAKTIDLAAFSGEITGTITTQAIVDTTTPTSNYYQIWVVDSRGNESNRLSGTFTVLSL
jgi:hypothetical protein